MPFHVSSKIIIEFYPFVEKAKIKTIVSPLVTSHEKPFEHQEASPRSRSGSTLQANLLQNLDALALGPLLPLRVLGTEQSSRLLCRSLRTCMGILMFTGTHRCRKKRWSTGHRTVLLGRTAG